MSGHAVDVITADGVWAAVLKSARGRCTHCDSLAVEKRPSMPGGSLRSGNTSAAGSVPLGIESADFRAARTTARTLPGRDLRFSLASMAGETCPLCIKHSCQFRYSAHVLL